MKTWLRHIAALVLVVFVMGFVTPTLAHASEDVALACGTDQQSGQQTCGVVAAIYWGGDGYTYVMLSQGEFLMVTLFVVLSWALWEEILAGGPVSTCTNCQDGFTNRINAIPTP